MKGETKLKILKAIENGIDFGEDMALMFAVIITSPYGTSAEGARYRFHKIKDSMEAEKLKRAHAQRVYELLWHLEKDGLIASRVASKNKLWGALTQKGKKALERLTERKNKELPVTSKYNKAPDTTLKIVIFDVPEKERRKRNWLRNALRQLGFKMLQKSVFAGKVKLPREFLDDIAWLRMINHVQIFSVSKSGSLRQFSL